MQYYMWGCEGGGRRVVARRLFFRSHRTPDTLHPFHLWDTQSGTGGMVGAWGVGVWGVGGLLQATYKLLLATYKLLISYLEYSKVPKCGGPSKCTSDSLHCNS